MGGYGPQIAADMGQAFTQGQQERQQKKNRQEQLQDEQRNAKLGVYADLFHDNRISQAEVAHAIEDIYHDAEPEKKINILGRVLNRSKAKRQHQQFLEGKQNRATEEAGILTGAKQPGQPEIEADTAKKKAAIAALPALFPEATPEQLSEIKERILGGGAVHRPNADELKRQDYQAALTGGYKGSYEQWTAEQSARGRAAGSPPKTPQMKPGTSGGKNVFAYFNTDQKAWMDSNTQQPLTDFQPAPSFAQTGLWGMDVGYDNQGNATPVLLNRRTGEVKAAPAGIVAPGQTKDIEKQRTTAIASDSLLRTMLGNQKDALGGNQQAMLSLVANHIGMTLGAQKGARINQAVWNEAVESSPWLAHVAAKFGPDGYLSGVALTPQQVNQMVELGKQRRQILWQQFADTARANGVQVDVPEFQEKGGQPAPKKEGTKSSKKTIVVTPEDMQ